MIGVLLCLAILGVPEEDLDAPVTGDPGQAVA